MLKKILFLSTIAVSVLHAEEVRELVDVRDYMLPALWAKNSSTQKLYVRRSVAYALARVARLLQKRGLRLVIYNAHTVLEKIDSAQPQCKNHARGLSVDVWLETADGHLIPSPSDSANSVCARGDMFVSLMQQCGFNASEWWWHFDFKHWERFDEIVHSVE